ncbi:MAG: hypothetical protein C4560_08990 [Nitrospiraceae bacterium]|nr:MAG: hypothetical protein C4560_08990 [Nitrospiraceae bacterium]
MTTLFDKLGTFAGIELREDSVVVTHLKNSLAGMTLLSTSTFPLRNLKDNESAVNDIRDYMGKHGPVSRIFVSIPDRWAITKFADVPSVKGKGRGSLGNLMSFEIERHIPFNIDEVAYDFLVLKETGAVCSALFVAVHKAKMDFVRDFFEKLSLRPGAVTVSSFAVLNMLESGGTSAGGLQDIMGISGKSKFQGKKGEAVISLYIDGVNAGFSLLRDGICVHQKSFNAEKPLEDFLDDTSKYLDGLRSRLSIEKFKGLVLSDATSSFPGLAEGLKERTGLNVTGIDRILKLPGNVKGIEINNAVSSIGACFAGLGIGTYAINLLPHSKEYETARSAPVTTKVLLVLILILVAGIFTAEAVKRKNFLTRIDEELKKNEPVVASLEKLTSETGEKKKRIGLLQGLKESEVTLDILAELAGLLPKEAWITTLDYKGFEVKDGKKTGGELTISGYAASSSTLVPLLEDSPYFEKVGFVGPIKKAGDKELFKLSAKIVIPAKQETKPQ